MTQHDKFKFYFETKGWREDPAARASKHTTMRHPEFPNKAIFIGASGGLRVGKNVSSSHAMSYGQKALLLQKAEQLIFTGHVSKSAEELGL